MALQDLIPCYCTLTLSLNIISFLCSGPSSHTGPPRQSLWTCCYYCLENSAPEIYKARSLASFWSLPKCCFHFIESPPVYLIWNCISPTPELLRVPDNFIHSTHYHLTYPVLCICCLFHSLKHQLHKVSVFFFFVCLSCSLLYPQHLEQCLACIRHSENTE